MPAKKSKSRSRSRSRSPARKSKASPRRSSRKSPSKWALAVKKSYAILERSPSFARLTQPQRMSRAARHAKKTYRPAK